MSNSNEDAVPPATPEARIRFIRRELEGFFQYVQKTGDVTLALERFRGHLTPEGVRDLMQAYDASRKEDDQLTMLAQSVRGIEGAVHDFIGTAEEYHRQKYALSAEIQRIEDRLTKLRGG